MGDEIRKKRHAERKACRRKYTLKHSICASCFYVPARERHHLDGNTRNNTVENVLLLCDPCHDALHTAERWAWDRSPERMAEIAKQYEPALAK